MLVGLAVDDDDGGAAGDAPTHRVDAAADRVGEGVALPVRAVAEAVGPSVVTISADVAGGRTVGTGVIVSADGEILTNAHVVAGATEIRVRLAGETEPTEAELVASDSGNDLALLSIDGERPPAGRRSRRPPRSGSATRSWPSGSPSTSTASPA